MKRCDDPYYLDCRADIHDPGHNDIHYDGTNITTACTRCGALLTVERVEWWSVYDEAARCVNCGEGAPFCSCEDEPERSDP